MSMRANTALDTLHAGGTVLNGWIGTGSPHVAEVMANQRFDTVLVDFQHGSASSDMAATLFCTILNAGAIPLARVGSTAPSEIMRLLDLGAFGVMGPLIDNAEEAAAFAAACRYPPRGQRSFGPARAATLMGPDYTPDGADARVMVMVQIETKQALDNLEEIAATEGVDGLYLGPADLALALGYPLVMDDVGAEMTAILDRVVAAAEAAGKFAGVHAAGGEFARRAKDRGARFVTVGSDTALIAESAKRRLALFHE